MVVVNDLPQGWTPDSILVDGMLIIQTAPILGVTDYCKWLLNRFVLPHFTSGVIEVHIIFDCQNMDSESTREILCTKKGKKDVVVKPHHVHILKIIRLRKFLPMMLSIVVTVE